MCVLAINPRRCHVSSSLVVDLSWRGLYVQHMCNDGGIFGLVCWRRYFLLTHVFSFFFTSSFLFLFLFPFSCYLHVLRFSSLFMIRTFGRNVFVLDTCTYKYIHDAFIMHPPSCFSTAAFVISFAGEHLRRKTGFGSCGRSRHQNLLR